MSCVYTSEIFSLGADPVASAMLERHAVTCPDCGPALQTLRSAATTLDAFQPTAALGARARIWRGIAQGGPAKETPRWVWPLGISALAAGALVAVLIGRPSSAPPPLTLVKGELRLLDAPAGATPVRGLPQEAWVKTSKASTMDLGSATLETKVGSIVRLAEVAPHNVELRLFRGDAALNVDRLAPTEVLMVTTRQARIQAFSSRVLVQATDRETVVRVQDGRVLVYREGENKPVMLFPGQTLTVGAASAPAASAAGAAAAPVTAGAEPVVREPVALKEPVALTEPLAAQPVVVAAKPSRALPAPPPVTSVARAAPSAELVPPPAASPEAAAQNPPSAPPAPLTDSAAQLSRARKALESDAPKAAELANEVLSARPDAKMEVAALLVLADAERRRGATQTAADLYARVAKHPAASAFAEEALLQSASLLSELGDATGALAALAQAAFNYADGPLAPERARLEADIELSRGRVGAAVRALERAAAQARAKGDETSARAFDARAAAIAPK